MPFDVVVGLNCTYKMAFMTYDDYYHLDDIFNGNEELNNYLYCIFD